MIVKHIQPWRSDKNIGKANNDDIKDLPDNCWICLTDGDSQWLLPNWGEQVENIIKANGSRYGLIGCITNRVGGLRQCYNNEFCEDFNVLNHYPKALKVWKENGTEVIDVPMVAGMCMIFSKETWIKTGGFKEHTILADKKFNKSIKELGLKIGLAIGLYRFHSYRIWEHGKGREIAQGSYKHLR